MPADLRDLVEGLGKIRSTSPALQRRHLYMRAGLPTFPGNRSLDDLLPTAMYISLVALFDEALERTIGADFPEAPANQVNSLAKRIDFFNARGRVADAGALAQIRDARNAFAHDHGRYATWADLSGALDVVGRELSLLSPEDG